MKSSPHQRFTTLLCASTFLLLQACSTLTHFEAVQPGSTLSMKAISKVALPADMQVDSKATGQHPFMAVSASGEKLYGLLPLHVNGGTMTTSILFFAPALFIGGFRDAYPFYQFDPDAGVLRYRKNASDEWRLFKPSEAEAARAKALLDPYASAAAAKPAADGIAAKAADTPAAAK